MITSLSIKTIKGIGPKKYLEFSKLGIETIEDLLYFFPKSYQDRTKITPLSKCKDGKYYGVIVKIMDIKEIYIRAKKMTITKVTIKDKSLTGEAIWFNMPFIKNNLINNETYFLYGKIQQSYGIIQIHTPDYKLYKDFDTIDQGILPLYKLPSKLNQKELRRFINLALNDVKGQIIEYLPFNIRKRYNLCDLNFALKNIHFPQNYNSYKLAKTRLIFDEFFLIQFILKLIKKNNSEKSKGLIFKHYKKAYGYINRLPFKLTSAQNKVLSEIIKDFSSGKIMNRLIQGDVGSGKTIIAIISLYIASLNGYQGAMMAPTEILANQHYLSLCNLLQKTDINICLLTSNIHNKAKEKIIRNIKEGKIDIIIGTHAIIQEDIQFHKLGLVITDEQHRFGVKQRALLNKKGLNPHTLVMSATPIPRTLTYTLYGDLDISIIDELPPGRKDIKTFHINNSLESRLYEFIKEQINQGRQAYFVCPLVEDTDKINAQSVINLKDYLEKHYFFNYKLALMHGRLKSTEKKEIMDQFKMGNIDILISTTIIEVGINVPNANIMVIQNAERFGLAQLHQLRGRIGRGKYQSYCFLLTNSINDATIDRMEAITSTNDGFKIAEKDLMIRGPGEILGVKQHGLPELRIGNLFRDIEILTNSRNASEQIVASGEFQLIEEYLKEKFHEKLDKISFN